MTHKYELFTWVILDSLDPAPIAWSPVASFVETVPWLGPLVIILVTFGK